MMRPGDYVTTKSGHKWVIALILNLKESVGTRPAERYVHIVRLSLVEVIGPTPITDLIYALIPADDALAGWSRGPEFHVGERFTKVDETLIVHSMDDHFVYFTKPDGTFTAWWRWQLVTDQLHGYEVYYDFEEYQAQPEHM